MTGPDEFDELVGPNEVETEVVGDSETSEEFRPHCERGDNND